MPIGGQIGGLFKFLYFGGRLNDWAPAPTFSASQPNPMPVPQTEVGNGTARRNRMYLMKPGFVFNPMTDTWVDTGYAADDSQNIKAYLLEAGNGYQGYIQPTLPSGTTTGVWQAVPIGTGFIGTNVKSVMWCTTGAGIKITASNAGSIGPFSGLLVTTDFGYMANPTPLVMGYIDLSTADTPSYVQSPSTTFTIQNLTFELN